ncbi:MAG: DUF1501 domain-containing protein [Verrucomicrobiota bacterium]|nr:DUF1501 domain-containing protein [Verrucomicrobiota bacterium]
MFQIGGQRHAAMCDGLNRRDFLRVGALGGLTLPQLLAAEQAAGSERSHKALIMIYMAGAPPHQDLIDLKPNAPREYRGILNPISTNVPGIQISELLPNMAKIMDKWSGIRSIVGAPNGSHDSFMCYSGRQGSTFNTNGQASGGWPSIGAAISKLQGTAKAGIPPFIGLAPKAGHPPYGASGKPGFLGAAHGPFKPTDHSKGDLVLNGVNEGRFGNRKSLLEQFDLFRRDVDTSGRLVGMDAFTEQALGILTSSKMAEAMNLEKEAPKIRERYGNGDAKNFGDGAPRNNTHFLMARRLVEAGARVVTLNFGRWDFHDKIYNAKSGVNGHAPIFDQGLAALIQDLHDRGMDKDVAVVAWGEFGRTPKINAKGGRDHWPNVSCAFVSGGGMNHGQMIGASDKHAAEPAERPVHMGEVHATMYRHMGIDPNNTTLADLTGRPQYLVDEWKPMPELI